MKFVAQLLNRNMRIIAFHIIRYFFKDNPVHGLSLFSGKREFVFCIVKEEHVAIDEVYGHGGLFKTKRVGQSLLAAALDVPVIVMETAGEGGAWGIALLAVYMANKEGIAIELAVAEHLIWSDKDYSRDSDVPGYFLYHSIFFFKKFCIRRIYITVSNFLQ